MDTEDKLCFKRLYSGEILGEGDGETICWLGIEKACRCERGILCKLGVLGLHGTLKDLVGFYRNQFSLAKFKMIF